MWLWILIIWVALLLITAFLSIRWLTKEECLLVKRGKMVIKMKQGLNFLIPFYDRVIANIIIEGVDLTFCNLSIEGDSYQLIGSYKIPDEFQNEEIIAKLSSFTQTIGAALKEKILSDEIKLEEDHLDEISARFEDEIKPVIAKEGIEIFNLKLKQVV